MKAYGGQRVLAGDHPGAHRIALADCLADHVLERLVGCPRNGARQRAAERLFWRQGCVEQHAEANLVEELRLRRLVENAEAGGDIGLERKMMQQSRTEGVNGLHLQSARRFQRTGKQFSRASPKFRGRLRDTSLADRRVELFVIERDPVAKRREHPFRHVGGGGLGEGDAKNLFRRHAIEQQADHPLNKNVRLARAGIRRDKGRRGGIGRARLCGTDGFGNRSLRLHHSSIPRPPAADHSFMRARSS